MAVFFWLSLGIDHRGFIITSEANISVEQLLEKHTRTLYTLILHNTLYNTTKTHPDVVLLVPVIFGFLCLNTHHFSRYVTT